MEKHKYEEIIKFVKLDGVKEFKETNPKLFSEDGISTSTTEIEDDKKVIVTMKDAEHACQLFLNKEITLFQLQQWGEWIQMMDFFIYNPDPSEDEVLVKIISSIDDLDGCDNTNAVSTVKSIINKIQIWLKNN